MPSQYGEHIDILRYFEGKPGRFLDVGAGDGLTLSNTEPLLHVGWSGVMIEPAISQLRWLIENHADNPDVEIITAALFPARMQSSLSVLFDARNYSTVAQAHQEKIQAHGAIEFRRRVAPAIAWRDIVAQFEFINIDVEGINLVVLESLPFERLNPQMVCVEIDPEEALPRMTEILAAAGLKHTKRVGGNLLAAREVIA